jgi:hypothetical protein
MPLYYFVYSAVLLGAFLLLVRYLLLKRTSLSTQLFMKGMRAENNGLYEEATVNYENALSKMKKNRFGNGLEMEIRDKLKVLHTLIIYKRDQEFVRKDNSWIS